MNQLTLSNNNQFLCSHSRMDFSRLVSLFSMFLQRSSITEVFSSMLISLTIAWFIGAITCKSWSWLFPWHFLMVFFRYPRRYEMVLVYEKPIQSPNVPPIDPIMVTKSKIMYSSWTMTNPGLLKVYMNKDWYLSAKFWLDLIFPKNSNL